MMRRFALGLLALSCAGCAELAAERSPAPTTAAPAPTEMPEEEGLPAETPTPLVDPKPTAERPSPPSPGSETTPSTAIPPPVDPPDRLALSPAPTPAAGPSPQPREAVAPPRRLPPPEPPKIPGRAVARVGSEVVTLPELTADVRARIARISGGAEPTRRQIIALARSALESRIQRSLILQEARRQLDAPGQLDATLEAIDRRWLAEEFPRLLRREGALGEEELAPRLAARGLSVDDARDRYRVRSLAIELLRRESGGDPAHATDREIGGYLEKVRGRFPVESVMTRSEIAAASGDPDSARDRRAAGPDDGAGR